MVEVEGQEVIQLDQELFMVSDFKELLRHHHMATIDSQHPMLLIVLDASSLILTKVKVCGGKLILVENSTFNWSK